MVPTGLLDPPDVDEPPDARAARLERGELFVWPACPWGLPSADDLAFLRTLQLSRGHKNISFDPLTGRVSGCRRARPNPTERLRRVFAEFSAKAADWLGRWLPRYDAAWRLDRASFRTEEEATRRVRFTARNDLLHVDNFPTRPALGRRLLRVFVNVNAADPRVWVTSEAWPDLLTRFLRAQPTLRGLLPPDGDWAAPLRGFWPPNPYGRSAYDAFLLKMHHFLKGDDAFQERGRKRYWSFPPGSAWLLFADGLSHAVLRGQFALEHSFFVSREALVLPELAPLTSLERLTAAPTRRAA
jgi:3-deoxy-D-manno-oct-2-ulosonic acid (Kdo) hydroxylase